MILNIHASVHIRSVVVCYKLYPYYQVLLVNGATRMGKTNKGVGLLLGEPNYNNII